MEAISSWSAGASSWDQAVCVVVVFFLTSPSSGGLELVSVDWNEATGHGED